MVENLFVYSLHTLSFKLEFSTIIELCLFVKLNITTKTTHTFEEISVIYHISNSLNSTNHFIIHPNKSSLEMTICSGHLVTTLIL